MNNYISGNEGFIASHFLKRRSADGHDLKSGRSSNLLRHTDKIYDVVYHIAAHLSPTDDSDIQMHRTVLEYCKKTGAYLVYASSAAVYNPTTLYAVQKLYGEALFSDIPHTTLRFFNVYGDGGHGIVDKIKNGESILINGSGHQRRDYIHVSDVVDAIITAGENKIEGTFDVGTGETHTVNDLIELSGKSYEHINKDPGVPYSKANRMNAFPWDPVYKLEDYFI